MCLLGYVNGYVMQTHKVASFRKLTPGMLEAQRLAMANDIVETTKAEVALALKKSAPALGIDGTTYHILDILIGLTKADDWKPNRRPLVAISNEKLAEYVCRSKRTVVRSLKKLVEAGVLAYRDSSTGRRFIYRNDVTGEIDRGYGLDFSPARQRVKELNDIAKAFAARLRAEQEARRNVGRLSRAIQDMLDLDGTLIMALGYDVAESVSDILSAAKPNAEKAEALQSIYEQLLDAPASSKKEDPFSSQVTCEGDIDVTSYNNTNSQNSRNCNKRKSANANYINKSSAFGAIAPEKEHNSKFHTAQDTLQDATKAHTSSVKSRRSTTGLSPLLASVSIGLVAQATSELQETLGTRFDSWSRLVSVSGDMCLLVGLSESAWRAAKSQVGDKLAATVLAVTAEKALRDPESISSPGGYFRACIDRALDGKLLLHKSLYGLTGE